MGPTYKYAARLAPYLIFVIAFAYYITYYNYGIIMADEGIFVNSSLRILDGQVPYLDYQYYPPALNYILSGIFGLFGVNLLYERLLFVFILSVCASAAYLISRKLMAFPFSVIPSILFILTPGPWHKCAIPMILFLAALAGFRYISSPTYRNSAYCGLVAGLSVYFRLDTSGFASMSLFAAISVAAMWPEKGGGLKPGTALRPLGVYLLSFAAALLPAAVFLGYLQYHSGYFTYILERVFSSRQNLGLPFPVPEYSSFFSDFGGFYLSAIYYIPPAVYLLTAVTLLEALRRRSFDRSHIMVMLLLLLGVFSYNQTIVRTDYSHILQSIHIPYVLSAYLASRLYGYLRNRPSGMRRAAGVAVLVLTFAAAAFHSYVNIRLGHPYGGTVGVVKGKTSRLEIERAPVYLAPGEAKAIQEEVGYIKSVTGRNDPILCLPYMPMLYFLSDRRNPTRFDGVFPGTLANAGVRKRYLNTIETGGIRLIAVSDMNFTGEESGRFSVFAGDVNAFITDNYVLDRTIGKTRFYLPKQSQTPEGAG